MPIRQTLPSTKQAVFSIDLPDSSNSGMPTPAGTGFFVSSEGWFVTAAHVICDDQNNIRNDLQGGCLIKESIVGCPPIMCQGLEVDCLIEDLDFSLLKIDFKNNSNIEWLKGLEGFPFVEIGIRELDEGEPVYSFGYPLSEGIAYVKNENMFIGDTSHCPRATSAIISSRLEKTKMLMSSKDPKHYVLDKALNYGNSGGPILSTDTGKVHAFCSRFQPVLVPQNQFKGSLENPWVMIPSLYGIVYSLSDPRIIKELDKRKIAYSKS